MNIRKWLFVFFGTVFFIFFTPVYIVGLLWGAFLTPFITGFNIGAEVTRDAFRAYTRWAYK